MLRLGKDVSIHDFSKYHLSALITIKKLYSWSASMQFACFICVTQPTNWHISFQYNVDDSLVLTGLITTLDSHLTGRWCYLQ